MAAVPTGEWYAYVFVRVIDRMVEIHEAGISRSCVALFRQCIDCFVESPVAMMVSCYC